MHFTRAAMAVYVAPTGTLQLSQQFPHRAGQVNFGDFSAFTQLAIDFLQLLNTHLQVGDAFS